MDVHDGQMACENMQSAAQKGDKTGAVSAAVSATGAMPLLLKSNIIPDVAEPEVGRGADDPDSCQPYTVNTLSGERQAPPKTEDGTDTEEVDTSLSLVYVRIQTGGVSGSNVSLKTGEYEFLIPAEQADGSSACADVEWNRQQSTASAQQAAAAPVGLDTLSQSHQQAPSSGPAAGEQAPSAAGGGTAAAAGLDSATNWEEVYQEVLRKIRSCRVSAEEHNSLSCNLQPTSSTDNGIRRHQHQQQQQPQPVLSAAMLDLHAAQLAARAIASACAEEASASTSQQDTASSNITALSQSTLPSFCINNPAALNTGMTQITIDSSRQESAGTPTQTGQGANSSSSSSGGGGKTPVVLPPDAADLPVQAVLDELETLLAKSDLRTSAQLRNNNNSSSSRQTSGQHTSTARSRRNSLSCTLDLSKVTQASTSGSSATLHSCQSGWDQSQSQSSSNQCSARGRRRSSSQPPATDRSGRSDVAAAAATTSTTSSSGGGASGGGGGVGDCDSTMADRFTRTVLDSTEVQDEIRQHLQMVTGAGCSVDMHGDTGQRDAATSISGLTPPQHHASHHNSNHNSNNNSSSGGGSVASGSTFDAAGSQPDSFTTAAVQAGRTATSAAGSAAAAAAGGARSSCADSFYYDNNSSSSRSTQGGGRSAAIGGSGGCGAAHSISSSSGPAQAERGQGGGSLDKLHALYAKYMSGQLQGRGSSGGNSSSQYNGSGGGGARFGRRTGGGVGSVAAAAVAGTATPGAGFWQQQLTPMRSSMPYPLSVMAGGAEQQQQGEAVGMRRCRSTSPRKSDMQQQQQQFTLSQGTLHLHQQRTAPQPQQQLQHQLSLCSSCGGPVHPHDHCMHTGAAAATSSSMSPLMCDGGGAGGGGSPAAAAAAVRASALFWAAGLPGVAGVVVGSPGVSGGGGAAAPAISATTAAAAGAAGGVMGANNPQAQQVLPSSHVSLSSLMSEGLVASSVARWETHKSGRMAYGSTSTTSRQLDPSSSGGGCSSSTFSCSPTKARSIVAELLQHSPAAAAGFRGPGSSSSSWAADSAQWRSPMGSTGAAGSSSSRSSSLRQRAGRSSAAGSYYYDSRGGSSSSTAQSRGSFLGANLSLRRAASTSPIKRRGGGSSMMMMMQQQQRHQQQQQGCEVGPVAVTQISFGQLLRETALEQALGHLQHSVDETVTLSGSGGGGDSPRCAAEAPSATAGAGAGAVPAAIAALQQAADDVDVSTCADMDSVSNFAASNDFSGLQVLNTVPEDGVVVGPAVLGGAGSSSAAIIQQSQQQAVVGSPLSGGLSRSNSRRQLQVATQQLEVEEGSQTTADHSSSSSFLISPAAATAAAAALQELADAASQKLQMLGSLSQRSSSTHTTCHPGAAAAAAADGGSISPGRRRSSSAERARCVTASSSMRSRASVGSIGSSSSGVRAWRPGGRTDPKDDFKKLLSYESARLRALQKQQQGGPLSPGCSSRNLHLQRNDTCNSSSVPLDGVFGRTPGSSQRSLNINLASPHSLDRPSASSAPVTPRAGVSGSPGSYASVYKRPAAAGTAGSPGCTAAAAAASRFPMRQQQTGAGAAGSLGKSPPAAAGAIKPATAKNSVLEAATHTTRPLSGSTGRSLPAPQRCVSPNLHRQKQSLQQQQQPHQQQQQQQQQQPHQQQQQQQPDIWQTLTGQPCPAQLKSMLKRIQQQHSPSRRTSGTDTIIKQQHQRSSGNINITSSSTNRVPGRSGSTQHSSQQQQLQELQKQPRPTSHNSTTAQVEEAIAAAQAALLAKQQQVSHMRPSAAARWGPGGSRIQGLLQNPPGPRTLVGSRPDSGDDDARLAAAAQSLGLTGLMLTGSHDPSSSVLQGGGAGPSSSSRNSSYTGKAAALGRISRDCAAAATAAATALYQPPGGGGGDDTPACSVPTGPEGVGDSEREASPAAAEPAGDNGVGSGQQPQPSPAATAAADITTAAADVTSSPSAAAPTALAAATTTTAAEQAAAGTLQLNQEASGSEPVTVRPGSCSHDGFLSRGGEQKSTKAASRPGSRQSGQLATLSAPAGGSYAARAAQINNNANRDKHSAGSKQHTGGSAAPPAAPAAASPAAAAAAAADAAAVVPATPVGVRPAAAAAAAASDGQANGDSSGTDTTAHTEGGSLATRPQGLQPPASPVPYATVTLQAGCEPPAAHPAPVASAAIAAKTTASPAAASSSASSASPTAAAATAATGSQGLRSSRPASAAAAAATGLQSARRHKSHSPKRRPVPSLEELLRVAPLASPAPSAAAPRPSSAEPVLTAAAAAAGSCGQQSTPPQQHNGAEPAGRAASAAAAGIGGGGMRRLSGQPDRDSRLSPASPARYSASAPRRRGIATGARASSSNSSSKSCSSPRKVALASRCRRISSASARRSSGGGSSSSYGAEPWSAPHQRSAAGLTGEQLMAQHRRRSAAESAEVAAAVAAGDTDAADCGDSSMQLDALLRAYSTLNKKNKSSSDKAAAVAVLLDRITEGSSISSEVTLAHAASSTSPRHHTPRTGLYTEPLSPSSGQQQLQQQHQQQQQYSPLREQKLRSSPFPGVEGIRLDVLGRGGPAGGGAGLLPDSPSGGSAAAAGPSSPSSTILQTLKADSLSSWHRVSPERQAAHATLLATPKHKNASSYAADLAALAAATSSSCSSLQVLTTGGLHTDKSSVHKTDSSGLSTGAVTVTVSSSCLQTGTGVKGGGGGGDAASTAADGALWTGGSIDMISPRPQQREPSWTNGRACTPLHGARLSSGGSACKQQQQQQLEESPLQTHPSYLKLLAASAPRPMVETATGRLVLDSIQAHNMTVAAALSWLKAGLQSTPCEQAAAAEGTAKGRSGAAAARSGSPRRRGHGVGGGAGGAGGASSPSRSCSPFTCFGGAAGTRGMSSSGDDTDDDEAQQSSPTAANTNMQQQQLQQQQQQQEVVADVAFEMGGDNQLVMVMGGQPGGGPPKRLRVTGVALPDWDSRASGRQETSIAATGGSEWGVGSYTLDLVTSGGCHTLELASETDWAGLLVGLNAMLLLMEQQGDVEKAAQLGGQQMADVTWSKAISGIEW